MSAKDLRTCPRCGATVYKSARDDHERQCLLVQATFGSSRLLADLFGADVHLTAGALAARAPGVRAHFIIEMLVTAGVPLDDIDGRRQPAAPRPRRAKCWRCEMLLDAPDVRPSAHDPTLCAWCAADMVRSNNRRSRRGRNELAHDRPFVL